jgi:hypothetical protein
LPPRSRTPTNRPGHASPLPRDRGSPPERVRREPSGRRDEKPVGSWGRPSGVFSIPSYGLLVHPPLLLAPSCTLVRRRGLLRTSCRWGSRCRYGPRPKPIQPGAWKGRSANFVLRGFSEVRTAPPRKRCAIGPMRRRARVRYGAARGRGRAPFPSRVRPVFSRPGPLRYLRLPAPGPALRPSPTP